MINFVGCNRQASKVDLASCFLQQSSYFTIWDTYTKIFALLQVSAFFRVSKQKHPYIDVHQCVRTLIDAYGVERLMWGSDFPWVLQEPGCGYLKAWDILPEGLHGSSPGLLALVWQYIQAKHFKT
jgi:hypothetical protein